MERFSSRTIDELGRIALHSELRKKLNLEKESKVSFTVIDSIVILQQTETGNCGVCDMGMIEIPADIRHKFAWVANSKIAVYNTDSLLILKTA